MTALPAVADFTASTVTEAEFKTAQTNLINFLSGLFGTDGTAATALATMMTLGCSVSAKSAAYTVLAADRGKVFHCSGTWTMPLTAAATLGSGFSCAVINTGTGSITIAPYSTQLIDGVSTITLAADEGCIITCNGTAFFTIKSVLRTASAATKGGVKVGAGLTMVGEELRATGPSYPISVANGGTGATSASAAADNLSVVKRDHGHNAVGSLCFAVINPVGSVNSPASTTVTPGGTISGSSLSACGTASGALFAYGSTLSGTWRCLGYAYGGSTYSDPSTLYYNSATVWQRIA